MASETMNAEQRLERNGFKWLTIATLIFFFVYVGIHVGLNLTAQGTAPVKFGLPVAAQQTLNHIAQSPEPGTTSGAHKGKEPSETGKENNLRNLSKAQKFLLEISGPITISICSSLLIFSFGTFLLHGLKHLSLSAPGAFLGAFLIFVYGQVVVQLCGHAEIYVYNQSAEGLSVHWGMLLFSAAAYPAAFFSLFYLEHYAARVFQALSPQLPAKERAHEGTARTMGYVTLISLVLLCVKPLVLRLDDNASKFGVTVLLLLVEAALAGFVYLRARHRDHERKSHVLDGTR